MVDLILTDLKKLVEQLKKVETKLKSVTSKMKPEDRQNGKGQPNTYKDSRSSKNRAIAEASRELKGAIPRKAPKKAKKQYKLCEGYGSALNTHHTAQYKKSIAGGKSHKEWRGVKPPTAMSIRMLVSTNSWLNKPSSKKR